MQTISFCNQKGGVGKTTLNVLGGHLLAEEGFRVAIDDRDGQRGGGRDLVTTLLKGQTKLELFNPDKEYDYVMIDIPRESGPHFVQAIRDSDRVVLTTNTEPLVVASTQEAAEFILTEHKKGVLKPGFAAALLFTRVGPKHHKNTKSIPTYTQDIGLPPLSHQIPERSAVTHFPFDGLSVIPQPILDTIEDIILEVAHLKPWKITP